MSVAVATASGVEPDAHTRLLESAVAKNTRRLVPILGLAYLFNYLDRTSVGFAALQMNQTIGLTAAQFGWGAGILFFSYCLLEVPSNVLMYRYGARRWLARIMITWGLAAAATAFAVGPMSFYVIRFMLGVFEAGFFPGVIWYISIWFPACYRTRVLALFMASTPLSSLLGSPISAMLLSMDGFLGLGGWQWMFIIEGLPACILGLACLWLLADTPKDAAWLDENERTALVNELASERYEKPKKDLWAAMKDIRVVLLTTITFAFTIGSYGIGIWLPQILKGHGRARRPRHHRPDRRRGGYAGNKPRSEKGSRRHFYGPADPRPPAAGHGGDGTAPARHRSQRLAGAAELSPALEPRHRRFRLYARHGRGEPLRG
jgi:MFS transporter, ACS family, tartrate transporter